MITIQKFLTGNETFFPSVHERSKPLTKDSNIMERSFTEPYGITLYLRRLEVSEAYLGIKYVSILLL